jgi:hypothetical protein
MFKDTLFFCGGKIIPAENAVGGGGALNSSSPLV